MAAVLDRSQALQVDVGSGRALQRETPWLQTGASQLHLWLPVPGRLCGRPSRSAEMLSAFLPPIRAAARGPAAWGRRSSCAHGGCCRALWCGGRV